MPFGDARRLCPTLRTRLEYLALEGGGLRGHRAPTVRSERTVDYDALENLLADPKHRDRFKIGTFSAASNITGKVSDVDRLAAILHDHGALAFFDYATAAPYLKIDMSKGEKDAVFFSPHKMLGD